MVVNMHSVNYYCYVLFPNNFMEPLYYKSWYNQSMLWHRCRIFMFHALVLGIIACILKLVANNYAGEYGNTGCGVFKWGVIKLETFLPKNQHTQRKFLNFENWVNGEVSKVPKFDQNLTKIWLSKSIFDVKNYPNLADFFFI